MPPDLLVVELAPQQLVLWSAGAELDLPVDHFRQVEPAMHSVFCHQRMFTRC